MSANTWKDKIGRTRAYSKDHLGREDVVIWDVLKIDKEQWIKIEFISKNSLYSQGIRLAIDAGEGHLECEGNVSKSMFFWENTAPKEFYVKCFSPEGLLSVYNLWDEGSGPRSLMYGSGMIVEHDGTKTTYRCHDVTLENVRFDKVVFSIEKVSSEVVGEHTKRQLSTSNITSGVKKREIGL